MKHSQKSFLNFILYSTIIISLCAIVFASILNLLYDKLNINSRVELARQFLINSEIENLQNSVFQANAYLEYSSKLLIDSLQEDIKRQLLQLKPKSIDDIISELDQNSFTILNENGEILSGNLDESIKNQILKTRKSFTGKHSLFYVMPYKFGTTIIFSKNLKDFNQELLNKLNDHLEPVNKNDKIHISIFDRQDEKSFLDIQNITTNEKMMIAKNSKEIKELLTREQNDKCINAKTDNDNYLLFAKNTNVENLSFISWLNLANVEDSLADMHKIMIKELASKTIIMALIAFTALVVVVLCYLRFKKIFKTQFYKLMSCLDLRDEECLKSLNKELTFIEFSDLANKLSSMIDKRKKKESEKDQKISMLNHYEDTIESFVMAFKFDSLFKIFYANKTLLNSLNLTQDDLIGKSVYEIFADIKNRNTLDTSLLKGITWQGILSLKAKNGICHVKASINSFINKDGNTEYSAICYDISELIAQQEYISKHMQDPLTKLFNRQALLDKLANSNEYAFVANFDVLGFKHINEYHGFEMGDRVLYSISELLKIIINGKKLELFKLTNDSFAIIGKIGDWDVNNFANFAKDIINNFKSKPLLIDGYKFDIKLVFGISSEVSRLITSEIAKGYAKQNKEGVVIFDEKKELLLHNINLTQSLKRAIDENRIVIYKQAIINNSTKQVIKYECLLRMLTEDGKLVSPAEFLDIAKRSNLYSELTKIVIKESFRHFYDTDTKFSINLTIDDILSVEIRKFLSDNLQKFDGIGKQLTIEIVEDEGIRNFEVVNTFIDDVRRYGCLVAIDDFGTGYSNFEYLMKLKADFIKIDGSMIKNIDTDTENRRVVELMVDFSKRLGIKTVAEFVHSQGVSKVVETLGIDESQGFYFDEPKPLKVSNI